MCIEVWAGHINFGVIVIQTALKETRGCMKLLRGADRKKSPRVELWSTTTIRGQMHEEEQAKETKNEWPGR